MDQSKQMTSETPAVVFFDGDTLSRWEGEYFPENDVQLAKDVRKFGPNLAKEKKKGGRR